MDRDRIQLYKQLRKDGWSDDEIDEAVDDMAKISADLQKAKLKKNGWDSWEIQ